MGIRRMRRSYIAAVAVLTVVLLTVLYLKQYELYITGGCRYLSNSQSQSETYLTTLPTKQILLKSEPISFTTASTKSRDPRLLYINDLYVSGFDRPHKELCPLNASLVILVTSEPSHFDARKVIRRNWAQKATATGVVVAFMLGVPNQDLLPRIEDEDKQHGDIIMGRFIDTYSNLTLKTLAILEWVDTYCQNAKYLLKTDDDMDINVDSLLEITAKYSNETKTIWGKMLRNTKPFRSEDCKWFLSKLQYPDEMYPDYLSGNGYLMTSDCVHSLRELSRDPNEPYIRIEDAYFTGILATRLNIKRVHVDGFDGKTVIPR